MKDQRREDPPRWRRTPSRSPSLSRSGVEAEIGSAIGRIPEPGRLDDLRLEQSRRRIMQRARGAAPAAGAAVRRLWLRTCVLALTCFVLGGLAMAAVQRITSRRPHPSARATMGAAPIHAAPDVQRVHRIIKSGLFGQVLGDVVNDLFDGLHDDLSLRRLLNDGIEHVHYKLLLARGN